MANETSITKKALVADIQKLYLKHPGTITRDFYRYNGTFSEALWQKHFPTFNDFLKAAEIAQAETSSPETSEIAGDSWTISLPKTRIHTLDELLEYCKVDVSVWEVDRFVVNKWEVGAKSKREDLQIYPLYQVKAFLKKRTEIIRIKDEIAELKTLALSQAHVPKTIARGVSTTGNVLEINIPDIHIGKLAWPKETGYEPYDTQIGATLFMKALVALVERTKAYKFEKILFIVGNDLLNSDDAEGRTTSGTSVSNDGRYHKTFWKVRTTIVNAIEILRKTAPVKVIIVPGNHDTLAAWHLGDSLECYFHKYDDVEIDNQPTPRKYHQFGQVLLMFTHGHKGKREDYPLLMATEQPLLFGATKFREAHTGHIHQTKTQEFHGVRVRVLPALCSADAWHSEHGFVGNLRSAEAYVWNKEEGLIAQVFYNDDAHPPITTKREVVQ